MFRLVLPEGVADRVQTTWLVGDAPSDQRGVFAASGAAVTLTVTLVGGGPLAAPMLVSLSTEPFSEPDNTPDLARPVAMEEEAELRLSPRHDQDTFRLVAEAAGTVTAEVLDPGGHNNLFIA